MNKLPREFYTRSDVLEVARDLLGKKLVVPNRNRARVAGIIVETEAYRGPEDRASHAYGGRRTSRTETMYGIGGTAYVYFVYGMYNQFNVVTNIDDIPHAVLVRALEPIEGLDVMRRRRKGRSEYELTSGPGRLCLALGIDGRLNQHALQRPPLIIRPGDAVPDSRVTITPRIGISQCADWPLRWFIRDNAYVSKTPAHFPRTSP